MTLGYLLSNALNSGDKSGEKVSEQTLVEAANETSTILTETSSLDSTTSILDEINAISIATETKENQAESSSIDTTQKIQTELQNTSSHVKSSICLLSLVMLFIFVLQ